MENYFQAEAFNLDKVLDEFEQNEDETDTPTLSDAKWTQILAPPAHLLSLNPALAHADLSPQESPLPFKTLSDAPSSGSPGADPKRLPGPEPPSWGEERPADVHSPPLPQPNIGKLVGTDDQSPPPVTTRSALENGCPGNLSSPSLNGLSEEPPDGGSPPPPPFDPQPASSDLQLHDPERERGAPLGGAASHLRHTHFTFGEGQEGERLRTNVEAEATEPPVPKSAKEEEASEAGMKDTAGEGRTADDKRHIESVENGGKVRWSDGEEEECTLSCQEERLSEEVEEVENAGGEVGDVVPNGLATERQE